MNGTSEGERTFLERVIMQVPTLASIVGVSCILRCFGGLLFELDEVGSSAMTAFSFD